MKTIKIKLLLLYLHTVILFKTISTRLSRRRVLFLLATPAHPNLGDQAIAFAELEFIKNNLPKYTAVEVPLISLDIFRQICKFVNRLSSHSDIIMGHGGGNMGDQYPNEEAARRLIVESFPNNKIIIFPQTADFTKSTSAESELTATKSVYSNHKHLTLIAREQVSYSFMLKNFPNNKILLTPDIVLYLLDKQVSIPHMRQGSTTFLRQDVEKSSTLGLDDSIKEIAKQYFNPLHTSDTVSSDRLILTKRLRLKRLKSKWSEFSKTEVAITDRLHGMVFAAITDTPCLVFTNYNHKVSGTYQWIKENPNIILCNNINDLTDALVSIKEQGALQHNKPDFSHYWSQIIEEVNNG